MRATLASNGLISQSYYSYQVLSADGLSSIYIFPNSLSLLSEVDAKSTGICFLDFCSVFVVDLGVGLCVDAVTNIFYSCCLEIFSYPSILLASARSFNCKAWHFWIFLNLNCQRLAFMHKHRLFSNKNLTASQNYSSIKMSSLEKQF